MTTYYARVDYTYTSGDGIFTIPFSYLKESHIKVFINGVATTNFSFNTTSQITVNDTLTAGDVVSIRRSTKLDDRMVTFTNTSILNKDNQNLSAQQTFNLVQEMYDENTKFESDVTSTISVNKTELEATIAANKTELEAAQDTFEATINATIATVEEAAEKVNELEEAVETATGAATTAAEKATEAAGSADIALTKATELTSATTQITTNANNIGSLTDLNTTNKNNLVDAINEVNIPISTIAQAQAGTDDTTIMTPLKVKESIDYNNIDNVIALSAVDNVYTLQADKMHSATIIANATIALPTNITDYTNCMLDFSIATDCTLTLPNNIFMLNNSEVDLLTSTDGRNKLIFDTIDNGTTWVCGFAQVPNEVLNE